MVVLATFFFMYVTVLEFNNQKEFRPVDSYISHELHSALRSPKLTRLCTACVLSSKTQPSKFDLKGITNTIFLLIYTL